MATAACKKYSMDDPRRFELNDALRNAMSQQQKIAVNAGLSEERCKKYFAKVFAGKE